VSEGRPLNRVTVRIGGEEHVLRSTADPSYVTRCAEHLDRAITEVGAAGGVPPHRAVILAALSITDGYFRAEEELERLRREVSSRAMNLARRAEEAVDSS
jgi:cell division protein ZapA (FtsZ GTPase activity inhibitor)